MIELPGAPEAYQKMRDIYETMEPEVFYKNHWQLAAMTNIPASEWKQFLLLPPVAEYISQEFNLLIETQRRTILKDLDKNQRSVGTAQILNALDKVIAGDGTRTGPVFIYTYVPLNAQEANAPNVVELTRDPFRVE
jgi:hypothetical protein